MALDRLGDIQSMTGFARAEGTAAGARWVWELRSVNGKGLDLRFRLAPGLESVEQTARERIAKRFSRGSIQLNLTVQNEGVHAGIRVNREALEDMTRIVSELRGPDAGSPAIEQLLAIRGIVELVETDAADSDALRGEILDGLEHALEALAEMRRSEGRAVVGFLSERLTAIEALADAAKANPARSIEAIRARLKDQVEALLDTTSKLNPDRLHQEAALLAVRADIGEEIDRLSAHVHAARELFTAGGAIGRRLDFLAQELNRETNTLCAKSNDVSLTAIGLDLKSAVDQFREQVQNLE